MKRTFYAALLIAAFLMLIASPASVETWGDLGKWLFCKIVWAPLLFFGAVTLKVYDQH